MTPDHDYTSWIQVWAPIITNGLLLIIVFWQSWIYRRQWQVMQGQLELQGRQLEQAKVMQQMSDRPWVIDEKIFPASPLKIGERLGVKTVLRNTGKTPANNTKTRIWVHRVQIANVEGVKTYAERVKDFPRPDLAAFQSNSVLAPGNKMTFYIPGTDPITEEHWKLITRKSVRIYAYGIVTYDLLEGQGITEFCHVYDPVTADFLVYAEGNYAR